MMRWPAEVDECATMVMRETPGRSDRPTVNETMLTLRRRKRDATRVSTPGLSSTSATNVCSMVTNSSLCVFRCFNHRIVGPADHFVQCRACGHHRVNGVFFFHQKVYEKRSPGCTRAFDGRLNFGTCADGGTGNAVRVGELDEVGAEDGRGGVVLVVDELLPLAHHAEEAVVDDGDVDVEVLLRDGREFGRGHLKAAVSGDDPDFLFRAGDFCADSCG